MISRREGAASPDYDFVDLMINIGIDLASVWNINK